MACLPPLPPAAHARVARRARTPATLRAGGRRAAAPAAAAARRSPEQQALRGELPLLLYLPGIDGTGLAASRQFPSLHRRFDLRVFVTPSDPPPPPPLPPFPRAINQDRTPFDELVRLVTEFLEVEVPAAPPSRPCYLLGESFGGVLALAVAAARPGLVDRIVLVPPQLYDSLPLALAPVLGSPVGLLAAGMEQDGPLFSTASGDSMDSGDAAAAPASLQQAAARLAATAVSLLQQLPVLARVLPAETLAWKIELLAQGRRLQRKLPRAVLKVLPGRSHALLQEGGINLAAILEEEGFYVATRRMSAPVARRVPGAGFGAAAPIELPSEGELRRYADSATGLGRRLSSPVFVSTAPDGMRALGLANIPADRPLLLVGNHQTLALDLGLLCERFISERGVMLRGLAHPVIFSDSHAAGGRADARADGADGAAADGQAASGGSGPVANGHGGQAAGDGGGGGGGGLAPWDTIPAFSRGLEAVQSGRSVPEALLAMLPGAPPPPGAGRQAGGGGGGTDGRNAFRAFMTEFGAVPVSGKNFFQLMRNGEAVLLFPGGVREAYKRRGEEYRLFWPDKATSENVDESFVAPLMVPKLPPGRLYFCFQAPITTRPEDAKARRPRH
eukprot:scaffold25.g5096.t1